MTLLTAAPALSQGFSSSSLVGAVPLAITLGAGAFALLAMTMIRSMIRDGKLAERKAAGRIAHLRSMVDDYEALLSGTREITVVWSGKAGGARYLGQPGAVLPPGRRIEAVLDFASWLDDGDAAAMSASISALRGSGRSFDLVLQTRDGRQVRAIGWPLGAGAALRVRPTRQLNEAIPSARPDPGAAKALLGQLQEPAFIYSENGKPAFANAAYQTLAAAKGKPNATPTELADLAQRELAEIVLPGARGGYLRLKGEAARPETDGLQHLSAIIDALATP
ncbi:MAG: hypothetical protein Q7T08_13840, partial [Devosia sp.]|nr:hypothetical protein [Devosia sp.]